MFSLFFFFYFPWKDSWGRREGFMYRTPGIQKGPVDSHTRRIGRGSRDGGRRVLYGGWYVWIWGGRRWDSQRGRPASVTAQAVVLRKIKTSSIYWRHLKEGGEGHFNPAPRSIPLLRWRLEFHENSFFFFLKAELLWMQKYTLWLSSECVHSASRDKTSTIQVKNNNNNKNKHE